MSRLRSLAQYVLGLAGFFLLWWGGSLLVGTRVLPRPDQVFAYLASGTVIVSFLAALARTVGRAILGFSLAWIVALPAGFLMGRSPAGGRVGFFPLFLLQGAPPLFWVTPLVLWLGTDGLVAPGVAFLITLPLLTAHVSAAIRHIPEYEYDVFRIYAPRPRVIVKELYLPTLLPAVRSNIQLGFLLAIKGAMLAEWFAAQDGFGRQIRVFYQYFAMREFVGWSFLFLVVAGALSIGLRHLLDRLLPAERPTAGAVKAGSFSVASTLPGPASARTESLRVRDLSFGYGATTLFSSLSFTVEPQRPVVLSGESGCGKTTLAKCVTGLLEPWSGSVCGPGKPVLVFQEDALLAHRDALGNVLLPVLPEVAPEDRLRAMQALEQWGLGGAADRFPHELSGGMRKRLSMARASFFAANAVVMDEPFVNLDREARAALWAALFDHLSQAPMPCIIITHYPEELEGFPCTHMTWRELTAGAVVTDSGGE